MIWRLNKNRIPANRPAQRSHFLPYVYTSEELHKLLRLALVLTTPNDKIHRKTIHATLLILYATGATVSEVTRLVKEDIEIRNGPIKFSGGQLKVRRCDPLARDLVRVVQQYIAWQQRTGSQSEFLFSRIDGTRITSRALRAYFRPHV